MISHREAELLARRAALRERIRVQRQTLSQATRPLAAACARVDRMRALAVTVVEQVRACATHHPLLLGAALAVLVALRPRRMWRWVSRLFWLWRATRPLRGLMGVLVSNARKGSPTVL